MKVSLNGKLIDCIKNKSKDGSKDYYSLNIYSNGTMYRVGVNSDLYEHYLNYVNDDVELNDISIWIDGKHSLYIK